MSKIANFGAFLTQTRAGVIVFVLLSIATVFIVSPTVVIITDASFTCSIPDTDGISTKCNQYTRASVTQFRPHQ